MPSPKVFSPRLVIGDSQRVVVTLSSDALSLAPQAFAELWTDSSEGAVTTFTGVFESRRQAADALLDLGLTWKDGMVPGPIPVQVPSTPVRLGLTVKDFCVRLLSSTTPQMFQKACCTDPLARQHVVSIEVSASRQAGV